LPDLPGLPGAPDGPALPPVPPAPQARAVPKAPHKEVDKVVSVPKGVTEHRPSRPDRQRSGEQVTGVTDSLPTKGIGLMSAEEPLSTGTNTALALILGAMAAASATIFATTRRLRPGRR
ncbi:MAG TPA: hypothetical protein VIR33_07195, partial [Thermopolyspora sp.]